ncbi:MAG TPA: transposase [Pseudoxanthomonas sp.]|nr:transposase [Pseudoxanthomonas sp.]
MTQRGKKTVGVESSNGLPQSRQDDPVEGRLSIRKWYDLAPRLPGQLAVKSVNGLESRRFIEAVLWVAATDSTWPQLPKAYGNFHGVYQRFSRWARLDVWNHVYACLQGDPRLPGLQRMVRQQQEIEARRGPKARQTSSTERETTAALAARIHALEARLETVEKLLHAACGVVPQDAGSPV